MLKIFRDFKNNFEDIKNNVNVITNLLEYGKSRSVDNGSSIHSMNKKIEDLNDRLVKLEKIMKDDNETGQFSNPETGIDNPNMISNSPDHPAWKEDQQIFEGDGNQIGYIDPHKTKDFLAQSVEVLPLRQDILDLLNEHGIYTLDDLTSKTYTDLVAKKGMNGHKIYAIRYCLQLSKYDLKNSMCKPVKRNKQIDRFIDCHRIRVTPE